jgi:hypothetical protein
MARSPRNISFPHPVVGVGDDVAGALNCNDPELEFGVDNTTLSIDGLGVTNPTIAALVQRRDAAFAIRITCGATYYRETFHTHDAQFQHVLPSAKLVGEVKLQIRVCTMKRIEDYRPEGLHLDYEGRSFIVQPGDVLAVGDDFTVHAVKQFDPLATDIPSIMRIVRGNHQKGPFKTGFFQDQIIISLSHEDHARYGFASQIAPGIIHASIVLPVLCEAIWMLWRVASEDDMLAETQWFKRLKDMLEARGIDESASPLDAAQRLLEGPLTRALADTLKGREDD